VTPKRLKKAILPVWGLFFVFSCIDFFLVNKMNAFDSIAIGVEDILIILMCIYYLVVQIRGTHDLLVYSTANFWIIITFLIYLSGTFFLYIMTPDMIDDPKFHKQYTIINAAFYVLKNILLSVAMLMKTTPPKNQLQKNNDWDDLLSYNLKN
jgi:hypothetical protein